MNKINILPLDGITEEYNNLRIEQTGFKNDYFRHLTKDEIMELESLDNSSHNWNSILVTDKFEPKQIKHCSFSGTVRIFEMEPISLEFNDLILPVGLYNSQISSCDIGKNCAVHNVSYLSRYILGENVILKDINELVTSDHAKFGNGIVKEGENPKGRIELELANEAGGREVLPFEKMLTPDAYLWYKYRGNTRLMEKLKTFVEAEYDSKRGYYGVIGARTVIKNSRIIKDTNIGSDAYIKGCNKLKNLTIKSNPGHKTQIGEGCTLVNGIINQGCKVFYGVMAVRFQLMPHSSLKYGARLLNSILGENSTISCCEVLNSFIFPGHEQHHNSSFLIAALLKGQSNIASGATIGSNHNSRKNDGEIVAGRGFWPGLNCSLKHDSKFSSFNIVVKGSYLYEINNPLPFSLLSQNTEGKLEVFPGYWFVYNMYALKRNSWKYTKRDSRCENFPYYDYNFLAPDTVNEMIQGLSYLEHCAEYSHKKISKEILSGDELLENYDDYGNFSVYATNIENKNRSVLIHKPDIAYNEYKKMINFYAVDRISSFIKNNGDINSINYSLESAENSWVNCGGQFIPEIRVKSLIQDVEIDRVNSWDEIHSKYREFAEQYDNDVISHAIYSLLSIYSVTEINNDIWNTALLNAKETRLEMRDRVYSSREKDYTSEFRKITFDSEEEREAVIGSMADNDFLQIEDEDCDAFIKKIDEVLTQKVFDSYSFS